MHFRGKDAVMLLIFCKVSLTILMCLNLWNYVPNLSKIRVKMSFWLV